MSFLVKDKVALVTGANRGIGRAIVESLVAHGIKKVYMAVRNPESTTDLAQKFGDKLLAVAVDIGDANSIKSLAAVASDVQLVVNNAGVLKMTNPLSAEFESDFNYELSVNTLGLVRMARAFSPILEANGGGAFVQLNSIASITNFTDLTSYCASKAAAYSITQGLRDMWKEKNIKVLSVHPGPIDTDMARGAGFEGHPVEQVSEGIVAALARGDFHLFPDETAAEVGVAYKSFADSIVNAQPVANPV